MDSLELNTKELAWVGDAVLALWARKWILKQPTIKPGERAEVFIAMTSNKFLSALGEPTEMEAKIGNIYRKEGLEGSFVWMNENLLPIFEKQRANFLKSRKGSKRN